MDSNSDEINLTLQNAYEKPVKFVLFPKLPLELRLKIWKAACFIPRIIDLWATSASGFDKLLYGLNCPIQYLSHYRIPPALLQVSQEARTEGLKHYNLSFGTTRTKKLSAATLNFDAPAQIYVNWKCDIICPIFDFNPEAMGAMREDLRKATHMRRIALDEGQLHLARVLMKQASLDEIILYPKPGYYHRFNINRQINSKLSPLDLEKKGATKKIKSVGNEHPIRAKRILLELKRDLTNSIGPSQIEKAASQGSQVRLVRPKVTTMLLEIES